MRATCVVKLLNLPGRHSLVIAAVCLLGWLILEGWGIQGITLRAQTPGTASPTPEGNAASAVRDLLYRARLAMRDGKFDEAEALISQAERIGGASDPLVSRFEDTPEKARRTLASLRQAALGERASGNSQPAPAAAPAPATAHSPLHAARRALARGDLAEALRQVQLAKTQNVQRGPNDDSPEAVEQLIQQQQRFAAGSPPGTNPDAFHRAYAEFLLRQADQLILYQDLDTAEYLAQQAKNLAVTFRPFERSPDAVLQTIAARRRELSEGPRRLPPTEAADADGSKAKARQLLAQAQMEMDRGNLAAAQQLAEQARSMNVAWEAAETQPWQVLLEIGNRQRRRGDIVARAGFDRGTENSASRFPVQQGVYHPESDTTRVAQAATQQPTPAQPPQTQAVTSQGQRLYQQGLQALENQDIPAALELFRQAWRYEKELDPQTRQQLRDKLTLLQAVTSPPPAQGGQNQIEEIHTRQQIAQQQLFREIHNELRAAEQQRTTDPKGALNRMQTLRNRVTAADIDPAVKKQFATFVDRQIQDLEAFIDQNRAAIELDERNRKIESDRQRDLQELVQTQDKLAELAEQFNVLMEQQRYSEAEVIARQARQIAPDDPVVANMLWKSRFAHRVMVDTMNKEAKDNGFTLAMQSVDESSTPFDDRNPIVFGDPKRWDELTRRRLRMLERTNRRLSTDEQQIEKALSTRVSVNLKGVPLSEALKTLCDIANIPVFLDPQGIQVEGIASDQPVTLELPKEIPLRSALNIILQPLRLNYVIEDDVLKITSQGARNAKVYAETYNVADLVIPIPNFVPGHSLGLPEAIRDAHLHLGQYTVGGNPVPLTFSPEGLSSTVPSGSVLAQTNAFGKLPKSSRARPHRYAGDFRGVMGGVTEDDFQPLIDLITSTISPDSWDVNGGNGAIQPFVANLSLVISQTQDVHEQIADLLDQLRRLQDLQVTIEVRFITLNDSFFERIGIDFDFNVDDNSNLSTRTPLLPDDTGPSVAIGLDPSGNPTTDLDFQFRQGTFGAAVPQFGGFDAATAANFGFAILSDIEVFFLLQAAQGDRRSNVLQAPKVTMFNGQIATINDTANRPFVTQIIPVVADFAAAHMPVITVLSEGTSLSVQAVASQDRRFVRLTLVPVFSEVGEVSTFTFTGKTSTKSGTNVLDPTGQLTGEKDNVETVTEAATVQLPTFFVTSVSTTVNVPDGGTILLGGIKRLREARNESAVPMLGKIPYISRLFKNVGIGRDTNSLMMMVTPRIIIQEEEEAKLGEVSP